MTNRLQRWGERALGEVKSVVPRVASRFEPEPLPGAAEEVSGFHEVSVESVAPRLPQLPTPSLESLPVAQAAPPPSAPRPVSPEKKTSESTPIAPPPPSAVSHESPPPRRVPGPSVRPVTMETIADLEPIKPPPKRTPRRVKITPATAEPAGAKETPLVPVERQLDREMERLREWIATPSREQEPATPPAAKAEPTAAHQVITARVPERLAFSPPPPAREPAPAPLPPVEINIGTIIVRANPAPAPRPSKPSPAAGLAAFLARRNSGQP